MRRRTGEWGRIVEQLPPLDRAYQIDFRLLSDRLAEIPDDVNGILKLFDGRRTLAQVLEQADHEDLAAARALARLWSEQVIRPAAPSPGEAAPQASAARDGEADGTADTEEWFRGPADAPAPPPDSAARAAAPADPAPRIVRFPAKRKEPRPPLQIETTSAYPLPPPTAEGEPPSSSHGGPGAREALPSGRGVRPLAAVLLVAAAVLAGVGVWKLVAGRHGAAPSASAGAPAARPGAPAPLPSPAATTAR